MVARFNGGWRKPRKYPVELIYENNLGEADFYNFKSAGQYYEDEKFKLCIAWNGESLESFMQTILDHMGAILFVNPVTGKFQLTIPEDPTSYKTHTIYEKDIQKVTSFQRTSLAETINQITVTYVDFWTGDERSVTVQDIANINAQGKVVADERKYPEFQPTNLQYVLQQGFAGCVFVFE